MPLNKGQRKRKRCVKATKQPILQAYNAASSEVVALAICYLLWIHKLTTRIAVSRRDNIRVKSSRPHTEAASKQRFHRARCDDSPTSLFRKSKPPSSAGSSGFSSKASGAAMGSGGWSPRTPQPRAAGLSTSAPELRGQLSEPPRARPKSPTWQPRPSRIMDGDWSVANEDTEASKGPGGTLLGRRTFLSVHTYGDAYGPYRKPADRQARSAAGLATKEKEPGTRVHQPVKPALPQFRKSSQSPTPPPFPGPDTSSQNLGPDSSSQIPGPDSSSQILLSGARPDFEGRTHTGGSQGVCADDPEPELQPVPPHLPADTGASQANARGESSSEADTGGSPRHRTASQGEVPGGPTSVEATSSGSQSTPVQDSRAKLLQPESVTGRPVPAHSSKGSGENEASGSARAMAWAGDAERLQGDVPDVKMLLQSATSKSEAGVAGGSQRLAPPAGMPGGVGGGHRPSAEMDPAGTPARTERLRARVRRSAELDALTESYSARSTREAAATIGITEAAPTRPRPQRGEGGSAGRGAERKAGGQRAAEDYRSVQRWYQSSHACVLADGVVTHETPPILTTLQDVRKILQSSLSRRGGMHIGMPAFARVPAPSSGSGSPRAEGDSPRELAQGAAAKHTTEHASAPAQHPQASQNSARQDAARQEGHSDEAKAAANSFPSEDERRSLEKLELMEDGVIGAALRVKQRQLARETMSHQRQSWKNMTGFHKEWLEAKRTKMELQQQAVERSKQQDEVWILDARKRCHMKQREHERMVDKYEEGLTGTKGQRQRLERQAKRRGRKGVYGSVNVSSFSKNEANVGGGASPRNVDDIHPSGKEILKKADLKIKKCKLELAYSNDLVHSY
ncbi:hypothetical protein CYMTET_2564 [Cymbomonas tetramitiformis]|uniref:Uncharacterized protein n=1 Tax=Cymbomonas tetramitiformis TaxID=36881 RepID=A0AAE0H5D7_9CHLO|nr:hypothetical protein CYMTET_2564 [Cymbomonas tetramitiformis]